MEINEKQRQFTKIFVGLYLAGFLLFNWGEVSWMFNYRVVSALAYDFFNPYENSSLITVTDSHLEKLAKANAITPPIQAKIREFPYSQKTNSLEIPSLGLVTPLVIGTSVIEKDLMKDLDEGVVYYPGSVYPGQAGENVILGHSAPPNWPHIKHDWVFSNLTNLKPGDKIIVYFENRQYSYTVITTDILQKGQELQTTSLSQKTNILTLVSCWPPGKNYKRIAVQAQLDEPRF